MSNQKNDGKSNGNDALFQHMQPVKGSEHFAVKRALFILLKTLGVPSLGSKSLSGAMVEGLARVKVAMALNSQISSISSLIDGAQDALKSTPPDTGTAKANLAKAQTLLGMIAVEAVSSAKKEVNGGGE